MKSFYSHHCGFGKGCKFTSTNTYKMKSIKLRKGEYQVNHKGNTYTIVRPCHETEPTDGWYVYENEEFLFSHYTKAKCLKVLSSL